MACIMCKKDVLLNNFSISGYINRGICDDCEKILLKVISDGHR